MLVALDAAIVQLIRVVGELCYDLTNLVEA
ncbi:hypothetical protein JOD17_002161 [Geomicrobium sediminis]|uniref:Uncharacterized protein n=1 Tax=Geomicrobium sediminis TaxID=1347788 RepID=A0ABS2PCB3_9BACL|nr:hypothetical protein [Geomicrobium sediminis]